MAEPQVGLAPVVDPYPPTGAREAPWAAAARAVGAPGVIQPGGTVQVSTYPRLVARLPGGTVAEADANLLDGPFRPEAPGHLVVAGAVDTAVQWQVSCDNGRTWIPLNGGNAVAAGAWVDDQVVLVVPGDQVQLAVSAACTVLALRVVFIPSL